MSALKCPYDQRGCLTIGDVLYNTTLAFGQNELSSLACDQNYHPINYEYFKTPIHWTIASNQPDCLMVYEAEFKTLPPAPPASSSVPPAQPQSTPSPYPAAIAAPPSSNPFSNSVAPGDPSQPNSATFIPPLDPPTSPKSVSDPPPYLVALGDPPELTLPGVPGHITVPTLGVDSGASISQAAGSAIVTTIGSQSITIAPDGSLAVITG
jgi:hypothetical protein